MLALCSHFCELERDGRWRDIWLGVTDVVRVVGGTKIVLVDAFEDGH